MLEVGKCYVELYYGEIRSVIKVLSPVDKFKGLDHCSEFALSSPRKGKLEEAYIGDYKREAHEFIEIDESYYNKLVHLHRVYHESVASIVKTLKEKVS